MNTFPRFPPTANAVENRIAALSPAQYARTRNALDGAVSGLSPYLTHGFASTSEVLSRVLVQHDLPVQHKFVQNWDGANTFAMCGSTGAKAYSNPCTPVCCPTMPMRASCRLMCARRAPESR